MHIFEITTSPSGRIDEILMDGVPLREVTSFKAVADLKTQRIHVTLTIRAAKVTFTGDVEFEE